MGLENLMDDPREELDGCRRYLSELWAWPVGIVKRGEPLQRKTPLKRGGPLAKESAKTRALKPERSKAKAAALARDGGCIGARLVPDVECYGILDGHERLPRGRGGSPYELDNIITLCRRHHEWVHSYPLKARSLDLLS